MNSSTKYKTSPFKLKPLALSVRAIMAGVLVSGVACIPEVVKAGPSKADAVSAIRSGFTAGVATPELGLPSNTLDRTDIISRIQTLAEQRRNNNAKNLPNILTGELSRLDGAYAPVVDGKTMTIEQYEDRATIHWESFDIGKGYKVVFVQPDKNAIALNRVLGDAPLRSFIDGQLEANGRVILINQNGFLFGKNSVVDTQSLIVSTLSMDDEVFNDIGFTQAGKSHNRAAFSKSGDFSTEGDSKDILIEGKVPLYDQDGQPVLDDSGNQVYQSAQITSGDNGRVMMFAPFIANAGTLESSEGQVVLAASKDEIYLTVPDEDSSIRGLVVGVPSGGEVHNVGELFSDRGNVSLLGLAVNQSGIARATSSVYLNGSIHLKAQDSDGNAPDNFGLVQNTRYGTIYFGENSETSITPELSDTNAVTDSESQLLSEVVVSGKSILIDSDAQVVSTGGKIELESKISLDSKFDEVEDPEPGTFVYVSDGATLDVSGDDSAVVSVARNFVEVEARGNELADSPLQRNGAIRDKTLIVDVRRDTEFLNADTAKASISRSVGERMSAGGEVSIASTGNVTIENGATIDISGGDVEYEGASVGSSFLVTSSGKIVNIADADPNADYVGVVGYTNAKSTSNLRTFTRFEEGYIEGKDAGTLSIISRGLNLEGDVNSHTVRGRYQRNESSNLAGDEISGFSRDYSEMPSGGSLHIRNLNEALSLDGAEFALQDLFIGQPTDIGYTKNHPESTVDPVVLSPDLFNQSGLSNFAITNAGRIIVNEDLDLPIDSALALVGTQIIVDSDINSVSGSLFFEAGPEAGSASSYITSSLDGLEISSIDTTELPAYAGSEIAPFESAFVAINGNLNVGGNWVNDSRHSGVSVPTRVIAKDGGSIQIVSANDVIVGEESSLNVSSGAHVDLNGNINGGEAGVIDLHSFNVENQAMNLDSRLDIQGTLKGFGVESGGELILKAPAISVSNTNKNPTQGYGLDGKELFSLGEENSELLIIDNNVFERGGFTSYDLESLKSALTIEDNTVINLVAASLQLDYGRNQSHSTTQQVSTTRLQNLQVDSSSQGVFPQGSNLSSLAAIVQLPDIERDPVDLSLTASGKAGDADVILGTGSKIIAEPGAKINIAADTNIYIDGLVSAPSGEISAAVLAAESFSNGMHSRLWLGPNSKLSSIGSSALLPKNDSGQVFGEVLGAGSVELRANQGSVIVEEGSVIDVSAVTAKVNRNGSTSTKRIEIGGSAGDVTLSAAESIIFQGDLVAKQVLSEAGGSLTIKLDPNTKVDPSTAIQAGAGLFFGSPDAYLGETTVYLSDYDGEAVVRNSNLSELGLFGKAYVPVDSLTGSDFDSLSVVVRSYNGQNDANPLVDDAIPVIEFTQDTSLSLARQIILDAPVVRVSGDYDIELEAAYVGLGSSHAGYYYDQSIPQFSLITNSSGNRSLVTYNQLKSIETSSGPASLSVTGRMVEFVGELFTQGIGQTGQIDTSSKLGEAGINIYAEDDVRFRGTLVDTLVGTLSDDEGDSFNISYDKFAGVLKTSSDVFIDAERVYAPTLSNYSVSLEGEGGVFYITDSGRGFTGAPLSLGSKYSVNADHIIQDGNLFAPLGTLDLNAGSELILTGSSYTSTSAADVSAPFFRVENGTDLVAKIPGSDVDTVVFVEDPEERYEEQLPEQYLGLFADSVDIQEGSKIDVRGGTKSFATEFQPGTGGSTDILQAVINGEANGSFAIVPGVNGFAPYDPLETPNAELGQNIQLGDTIILEEGINGLPAGQYAVLPAQYALYGGYLVTPQAALTDISSNRGLSRQDGAVILSGRYSFAGSNTRSSRSIGFAIEDGDAVRNRAEYAEISLNEFYEGENLRAPNDGGLVSIAAQTALNISGQLVQGKTEGLGSMVDILGEDLRIVNEDSSDSEFSGLQLIAQQLEKFGAESYLIGGSRSVSDGQFTVDSKADSVTVTEGTTLSANEIILVGDNVTLESGASLIAKGEQRDSSARFTLSDDEGDSSSSAAAIVAVSDRKLTVQRSGDQPVSDAGTLQIANNARLSSTGSIIMDVAGDFEYNGVVDLQENGLLSVGASEIHLGDTQGKDLDGLVLSNSLLGGLSSLDLRLRSGSTITSHGLLSDDQGSDIEFNGINIDAQGLRSEASGVDQVAHIRADRIRLENTNGSTLPDGEGLQMSDARIALVTEEIEFGGGSFVFQNADTVRVEAKNHVLIDGDGQLAAQNLKIEAPLIKGSAGVEFSIEAQGDLSITGSEQSYKKEGSLGLASGLTLFGENVEVDSSVVLPSGIVTINAEDSLVIGENAELDVSGVYQSFGPVVVGTSGGSLNFLSETGNVQVVNGAKLDVAAGEVSEEAELDNLLEAGEIQISARLGEVAIGDETVFESGSFGGAINLVASTMQVGSNNSETAYSDLNTFLGDGFNADRSVRLRNQGITLNEDVTVRAHNIKAVSDSGPVIINGTLDASGLLADSVYKNGGRIHLASGTNVEVNSSATLLAAGVKGEDGAVMLDTKGGKLRISALNGLVNLYEGAQIDLSGGQLSEQDPESRVVQANRELGGEAIIESRWFDANPADGDGFLDAIDVGELTAQVKGAWKKELVATKLVLDSDGEITEQEITQWRDDIAGSLEDTYLANGENVGEFVITPGLMVKSEGDLTLTSNWDFEGDYESGGWHFSDAGGNSGQVAGHLSLLAEGDLIIKGDITDGFSTTERTLLGDPAMIDQLGSSVSSWTYTLTAGHDINSADHSAVINDAGNLKIGLSNPEEVLNLIQSNIDASGVDSFDPFVSDYITGFVQDKVLEFEDIEALGLLDIVVRTGTGDININSGGDVVYESVSIDAELTDEIKNCIGFCTDWNLNRSVSLNIAGTDYSYIDSETYQASFFGGPSEGIYESAFSGKTTASVYTAGRNLGLSDNILNIASESKMFVWLGGGTNFAVDGGDVSLNVQGDFLTSGSVGSTQWLTRIGETSTENFAIAAQQIQKEIGGGLGAVPAHWGLAIHNFRNGVGALGGGEIHGQLGGDVSGVTFALPVTGRTIDGAQGESGFFAEALEVTELAGGGVLNLKINGDLDDSLIHVGDGVASVTVTGAAGGSAANPNLDIQLGTNADVEITSNKTLRLASLQDPTIVSQSERQLIWLQNSSYASAESESVDASLGSSFYTYENSAVQIASLAGEVDIAAGGAENRIAPNVSVVSFNDGITIQKTLDMYPSSDSVLHLLAAADITAVTSSSDGNLAPKPTPITQPDINPENLRSIGNPDDSYRAADSFYNNGIPLHLGDTGRNYIVAGGSIITTGNVPLTLDMAKQTYVEAGQDIINISAEIQNVDENDITSFIAGRDIVQFTKRDISGALDKESLNKFEVSGPGLVEVLAGRQILLGTSDGIETIGNSENRFLADIGADLIVMAGLGEQMLDIEAFTQNYFEQGYDGGENGGIVNYRDELKDYLAAREIQHNDVDFIEVFKQLPENQQREFVSGVFFNELRASGKYVSTLVDASTDDYFRGFDAIATLFPDAHPEGKISLINSQIQTEDGGYIRILVPGGFINAGSAGSSSIDKEATELGIVSYIDDPVSIFVDGDLAVNSTRVFALQEDLLVWSSVGNIDAGKGAKTVSDIPPPRTAIGPQGETVIIFPPAVEGSGLQGVNVDLFAPAGVVIAGDAGIKALNDITIAAEAVVGADNIDVGGVAVGVPQGSSVTASFDGSSNVAATTSKIAENAASGFENNDVERTEPALGILSVEIDGFGEITRKNNDEIVEDEEEKG